MSITLYPFQQQVINWAQHLKCGIIGLDMGLGKTVITLELIQQRNYQHIIIVLPLAIVQQWRSAINKFTQIKPNQVCIFQGSGRKSLVLNKYRVVLTTYETIRYEVKCPDSQLFANSFDCMILDEAHRIRNIKTATHQSCYMIGQFIESKWLLTGTTIHNTYADFVALCKFLDLDQLDNSRNWQKNFYYRITKKESGIELPEKSYHEHFLNFDQEHLEYYTELLLDVKNIYLDYLSSPDRFKMDIILAKITRLRQMCNHPDAILNDKTSIISYNRHDEIVSAKFLKIVDIVFQMPFNDKIIIFSQWEMTLNLLQQLLGDLGYNCLEFNGSLSNSQRESVLRQFRTSPQHNILLMTIKSGGVGLDLSCANHIILIDSWWNQATEEQAIDRVYRIGQTKNVDIHRMYMIDSIESWMIEMKKEKYKIDSEFHQNGNVYHIDHKMLTGILHKYL